jgi:hypothetical protein
MVKGTNRPRPTLGQCRRSARSLLTLHVRVPLCGRALGALLSQAAATPTRGQASSSVEYQFEAACPLNLAKFSERPSAGFQNENPSIILCAFRHDFFEEL